MKLYIIAILIILFTSCSNKQFSFRDKVNVKREHVVKRDKPIKPHFLSKDSSINESITAAVNETFLPTNNFVEENNVVINFQDTPPKNDQRITPPPIGEQKHESITSPNLNKKTFPLYGLIGLVLSILGAVYFASMWFYIPFDSVGISVTILLLLLGLGFSVIGISKPRNRLGKLGAIISATTLLIGLTLFVIISFFIILFLFILILARV